MNPKTETKKRFAAAPEDIKDIITSFDTLDQLEAIGESNKLSNEQTSKLGEVFTSVLIGITPIKDFSSKLIAYLSITVDAANKIASEIDQQFFSKVRISLEKAQSKTMLETHESKDTILHDIENPAPVKPIVSNPAGKNPILDAQHNLPEQARKTLISSAAVPSRGPILNSLNTGLGAIQAKPTTPSIPAIPPSPMVPKPITPEVLITQPISKPMPPQPTVPTVPVAPVIPQTPPQPIQPPKPAETPVPPAPNKYTTDPYREPLE